MFTTLSPIVRMAAIMQGTVDIHELYKNVKAAIGVLYGAGHRDTARADAFLRDVQEKPDCVPMVLTYLTQAETNEESMVLTSMLKNSLTRNLNSFSTAEHDYIFHQLLEILSHAPPDNPPLVLGISQGVGQVLSCVQSKPCQSLLNSPQFLHLPNPTKLRLLTILPECPLWLDHEETSAVIRYVVELVQNTHDDHTSYLALPCLAAWSDLPTCDITLEAVMEMYPFVLELSCNVLCLRTSALDASTLNASDVSDWQNSLPLKTLFSAMELVESLLSSAESGIDAAVLEYFSAVVNGICEIKRHAPIVPEGEEDVIGRKLAMLIVVLVSNTLPLLINGQWEHADTVLQLELQLIQSPDMGVTELLITGDVFDRLIYELKDTPMDDNRQHLITNVLQELTNLLIQRCAYPLDWTSWDSEIMEEEDFIRFRQVHCRNQFISLAQFLGADLASRLLEGYRNQQRWEHAEAYLFAVYCCSNPLYAHSKDADESRQFELQLSLWELVQQAVAGLDPSNAAPLIISCLSVVGELSPLFKNQMDALQQAAPLVMNWLACPDNTVADAAAVAFAKLTIVDAASLSGQNTLASYINQGTDNVNVNMPVEGLQRLHEGLMRVATSAIDRPDGVQATLLVMNSILDRFLETLTHNGLSTPHLETEQAHRTRDFAEVLRTASYFVKPFTSSNPQPTTRRGGNNVKQPCELWQPASSQFVGRLWEVSKQTLDRLRIEMSQTRTSGTEPLELLIEAFSFLLKSLVDVFKSYIKNNCADIAGALLAASECCDFIHPAPLQTCVSLGLFIATDLRREASDTADAILSMIIRGYTQGLQRVAAQGAQKSLSVFSCYFSFMTIILSYCSNVMLARDVFPDILSLTIPFLTTNSDEIASHCIQFLQSLTTKSRKGTQYEQDMLAQYFSTVGYQLVFYILEGVASDLSLESLPRIADVLAPILHHPSLRHELDGWLRQAIYSEQLADLRTSFGSSENIELFIQAVMAVGDAHEQATSTNLSMVQELRQILLQMASLARVRTRGGDLDEFTKVEA